MFIFVLIHLQLLSGFTQREGQMNEGESVRPRFERHVRSRSSCHSSQPEDVTAMHKMALPHSNLDLLSPPWFTDSVYHSMENRSRNIPPQGSRFILGPQQIGLSLKVIPFNDMAGLVGSSMIPDPTLRMRPSIPEETMLSISKEKCTTSTGSILPPIHFLLGLLRHADGPVPTAISEFTEPSPGWTMPLSDVLLSDIASEHCCDQPSSSHRLPIQAGTSPRDTTTKRSWRRTPKRWGLAEWERDDRDARERRREQNREAQRRFREKRHRAAADLPRALCDNGSGSRGEAFLVSGVVGRIGHKDRGGPWCNDRLSCESHATTEARAGGCVASPSPLA